MLPQRVILPPVFVCTDQINRYTGTDMLDYNICTGTERQKTVSCHQCFFGNGWRTVDAECIGYFAMIDPIVADKIWVFFVKTDRNV